MRAGLSGCRSECDLGAIGGFILSGCRSEWVPLRVGAAQSGCRSECNLGRLGVSS
jgi:hypothetical protein